MNELKTLQFLDFKKAYSEWQKSANKNILSLSSFFDFLTENNLIDTQKLLRLADKADKKIRVGDTVEIIDMRCQCNSYIAWAVEHITDKNQLARFQFGAQSASEVNSYEVLALHEGIAYMEAFDGRCYMFKTSGLKKKFYKGE